MDDQIYGRVAIDALSNTVTGGNQIIFAVMQKGEKMDDSISRQAAIDAMEEVDWYHINKDGQLTHGANSREDEPLYKAKDVYKVLNDIPSAQPDMSKEYAKAVRTWLVQYQIECAKLEGRYTPYEVLCWIVEDWGKDNDI